MGWYIICAVVFFPVFAGTEKCFDYARLTLIARQLYH